MTHLNRFNRFNRTDRTDRNADTPNRFTAATPNRHASARASAQPLTSTLATALRAACTHVNGLDDSALESFESFEFIEFLQSPAPIVRVNACTAGGYFEVIANGATVRTFKTHREADAYASKLRRF